MLSYFENVTLNRRSGSNARLNKNVQYQIDHLWPAKTQPIFAKF